MTRAARRQCTAPGTRKARTRAACCCEAAHEFAEREPAQAAAARIERAFAERLYNGTALQSYKQGSLVEEFPGLDVSLHEYMHWSTVIGECWSILLMIKHQHARSQALPLL